MSEPKILRVGRYSIEYPQYWLNFLSSLPLVMHVADHHKLINEALMSYQARYYVDSEMYQIVVFDREEDATMFVLRWS